MEVFEIYEKVKGTSKGNEVIEKIIRSYDKALHKINSYSEELSKDLKKDLYIEIYGCHFNEWLLNKATSELVNEDGTTGPHWTLEQTNNAARQYDISFTDFNEYDWNYAMNTIYSDYYGAISNEVTNYIKLAKKFIMDKDAPKGKAFHYYMATKY